MQAPRCQETLGQTLINIRGMEDHSGDVHNDRSMISLLNVSLILSISRKYYKKLIPSSKFLRSTQWPFFMRLHFPSLDTFTSPATCVVGNVSWQCRSMPENFPSLIFYHFSFIPYTNHYQLLGLLTTLIKKHSS